MNFECVEWPSKESKCVMLINKSLAQLHELFWDKRTSERWPASIDHDDDQDGLGPYNYFTVRDQSDPAMFVDHIYSPSQGIEVWVDAEAKGSAEKILAELGLSYDDIFWQLEER